jgi:hypothetical protein
MVAKTSFPRQIGHGYFFLENQPSKMPNTILQKETCCYVAQNVLPPEIDIWRTDSKSKLSKGQGRGSPLFWYISAPADRGLVGWFQRFWRLISTFYGGLFPCLARERRLPKDLVKVFKEHYALFNHTYI